MRKKKGRRRRREETGTPARTVSADEMEEGMDLFEDIIKEDEQETVAEPVEEEAEVVFSHESTSGFTIGQLLADHLKSKARRGGN